MASFDSIADSIVSAAIVDALGGPYHALALRATSRRFRELIPAPEHLTEQSDIAIVMASLGNTDACIRALEQHGGVSVTIRFVALEAALGNHRDLCKRLLKIKTIDAGMFMMKGAAIRNDHELCANIVNWGIAGKNWSEWDPLMRAAFFDVLMSGAIEGNNAEMVQFLRERCIEVAQNEPVYCGSLCTAARMGRADICLTIRDWMIADHQAINVGSAMYYAALSGHEALAALISTWGPRDLRRVTVNVVQEYDSENAGEIMRRLIKNENPRDYVDAIADMTHTAINMRNARVFSTMQDWLVDARGRAYKLDELRATLDLAVRAQSTEIIKKIREQIRARFGPDADA